MDLERAQQHKVAEQPGDIERAGERQRPGWQRAVDIGAAARRSGWPGCCPPDQRKQVEGDQRLKVAAATSASPITIPRVVLGR